MFRQSSVEWHEFLGFPQQQQEEDHHHHYHHHPTAVTAAASTPGSSQLVRVRVSQPSVLGKQKRAPWQAEAEEY
jgi:hypothetical protein